jgi:hypothetical protein
VLRDEAKGQTLDASASRRELRKLMEYATAKMGSRPSLTSAMVAFTPRDPKRVVIDRPFKREFLLTPLTEAQARPYFCDPATAPLTGQEYYYGVVFQFRIAGGGLLGLLWTREQGQWKMVSYQPLSP